MSSNNVKRQAYTSHLSRAVNTLTEEISKENPNPDEIKVGIEKVQVKFNKVLEITSKMQDEMTDETLLAADIDKMEEIENKVISLRTRAKSILEKQQKIENIVTDPTQPLVVAQPPPIAVKLPDAKLPEFSGEYEKFPSFIDSFTALVHNNPNITDIEKFGYLRGVCKLDIIQHTPMTSANYKIAINRLKEEYGDTDLIAAKHRNALLDKNKRKKPSNLEELQEFFNYLETKMTCLDA